MMKSLEVKMCEEWLKAHGLFSTKKRRLREGLTAAYS